MRTPPVFTALLLTACISSAQTLVPVEPADHSSGLTTPIREEPRTIQLIFASSLLLGMPSGSTITGMSFRLYSGAENPWPAEEVSWENYDVQFSGSPHAPGSLSSIFDENIGTDAVMVRSGSLTIGAEGFPAGGDPNAFGVEIVFTTPYTYTGGNLLITIRHSGNGISSDGLESTAEPGDYQLLTATGYDAIEGAGNDMLITQLSYVVPEPSSLMLLAGSVTLLAFRRRGFRTCPKAGSR